MEEDPKELIKKFVVELLKRASEIEETVGSANPVLGVYKKFNEDDKGEQYGGYLINEARVKLSKETAKSYVNWVKQVPVFGFNSGRYDINMIKEYFVEKSYFTFRCKCSQKRKFLHVSLDAKFQIS